MARVKQTVVAAGDGALDLAEKMPEFYADPLGFVRFAFAWGEEGGDLQDETGPDVWQTDFMVQLGEAVRSRSLKGGDALGAYLAGAITGNGVGKTALIAWVVIWFMSTRTNPQVRVTANTLGQLTGTTWREVRKWHRRAINEDWFTWTATTFYLKWRPDTHKAQAMPWSKDNAEAFQGLHEKDVLMIMDEASGISDNIWEAGDGSTTTPGCIWLAFGNPTKTTGRFRETMRKFRHRWNMMPVDSRTAKKANKGQIEKWIEDYGEDSDFVRKRVKGEFPRSGSSQLIGEDLVLEAQKLFRLRFGDQLDKVLALEGPGGFLGKHLDDNVLTPKIMMLDVARFGIDQSVLGLRQGKTFLALEKWRELDTMQLAYRVAVWLDAEQPDLFLVDAAGIGGGVADVLRDLGYEVEDTNGGMTALDPRRFFNRRAEMWWLMMEWLKKGGRLNHLDVEIKDDLTGPEYGYSDRGDRVQLESKDDMKSRGLPSPDTGDCLAMSFWMPVAMKREAESVAARLAQMLDGGSGYSATSWKSA